MLTSVSESLGVSVGSTLVSSIVRTTALRAFQSSGSAYVSRRWRSVEVPVPSMGESITEGTIAQWKTSVGDRVLKDQVLAVVDTDKISVEIKSPYSGTLQSVNANNGDVIFVGKPLCSVDADNGADGADGAEHAPGEAEHAPGETTSSDLPHRGYGTSSGESSASDNANTSHPDGQSGGAPPRPDDRGETVIPISRMRKRIAERLKAAQTTAACLTTFQECDMSKVLRLRKEFGKEIQEKYGVKLGFMSFFMMACARALQNQPVVNSSIQEGGLDNIVQHNYVDLSIAVATPNGLTVPVIRNAEKKGLLEMEKALHEIAKKARENKLVMEDMAGGTFTISNGGIYGSFMGTPILNPPQSAILGMHSIVERAVVKNCSGKNKVVTRPIMMLALTYDHRLVDGREAVTFLKSVVDYIENPEKLLVQ